MGRNIKESILSVLNVAREKISQIMRRKKIAEITDGETRIINDRVYEETLDEIREVMLHGGAFHLEQNSTARIGKNLYAAQDKGVREMQQDAVLIMKHPSIQDFNMMVVADGMGGEENGEKASKTTIEEISKWFENIDETYMIDGDVKSLKEEMNRKIRDISIKVHDKYPDGGTTLVCAIIKDGEAIIANVGDSRAYKIKDRKIKRITEDHSWAKVIYEKKYKEEGFKLDDMRFFKKSNLIYQNIGLKNVKPDFYYLKSSEYDALLLCSDGVYGILGANGIKKVFADDKVPKEKKASELVRVSTNYDPKYYKYSRAKEYVVSNEQFDDSNEPAKDNASTAIYFNDEYER